MSSVLVHWIQSQPMNELPTFNNTRERNKMESIAKVDSALFLKILCMQEFC